MKRGRVQDRLLRFAALISSANGQTVFDIVSMPKALSGDPNKNP
jgi:hypothetical protein